MDRRQSKQGPLRPRLVLVTPLIEDAAGFAPHLAAACAAADVAAVILRLTAADETRQLERVRLLAPAAQKAEAALVLDGLVHLVAPADADGAHVSGSAAVAAARAALGHERIVGAGRLTTRHDAMVAGEAGADYVLFGESDAEGTRPSLPALVERVGWWAELFELSCVAYAAHIDEIAPLVEAGADFIALGEEMIWNAPDGPAAALVAAASRLVAAETAR